MTQVLSCQSSPLPLRVVIRVVGPHTAFPFRALSFVPRRLTFTVLSFRLLSLSFVATIQTLFLSHLTSSFTRRFWPIRRLSPSHLWFLYSSAVVDLVRPRTDMHCEAQFVLSPFVLLFFFFPLSLPVPRSSPSFDQWPLRLSSSFPVAFRLTGCMTQFRIRFPPLLRSLPDPSLF